MSPGREASGNWNANKLNMFASISRRYLRIREVPRDADGWREEGSCYSSPYISFLCYLQRFLFNRPVQCLLLRTFLILDMHLPERFPA